MANPRYIYHLVPPRVEGEYLMPLSRLREEFPQLHEQHLAKYVGREMLISRPIPHINRPWTDVLQLTPVHPQLIKNSLLEVGFGWRPMLFFEIDPVKAGMDSSNTVIYRNLVKPPGEFAFGPEEFVPYTSEEFARNADLPEATREHFREAKAGSGRPMIFLWVPHVLFTGTIPVQNLKIVEI